MKNYFRIIAAFLVVVTLFALLPNFAVEAAKVEAVVVPAATHTELESTAAALKTEIASLAEGKNRNGRVRLSAFKQSSDGTTDMINIKGKHYLVRNQGDGSFYALNGAWTSTDGDLPTVSVTASDTTNFYYIVSGISTTMAFNLIPAGTASNGMPAYQLQFNNGKYLGIGSQYTGTYTNLYHVKASTSKDKVRFEHSNGAGNFGIRNFTGTHGLRQNNSISVFRWKDNSAGDNSYTGNVLYMYRLWSTSDLRAAINEMKGYLDSPAFYDSGIYAQYLTCVRESIDLFNKYNTVPKAMIEPYDYIQDTLDAKAKALRAFKNKLVFTIEGLNDTETNAATTLYQLPSMYPRAEGDFEHNMSYIIKTRKGKIIMVDGGWQHGNYDGNYLYSYLCKITGDTTPHITAWFMTHPHGDHYGAFSTLATLYADKVTVDAVYQHNPSDEQIEKYFTAEDAAGTKAAARRVMTMAKELKNADGGPVREVVVNSLASGKCNSSFDFDEVHIDILLDINDVVWAADNNTTVYSASRSAQGRYFKDKTPKQLLTDNLNECSIIFRATVHGKNILFTGDAGFVAGLMLLLYHNRNANNPETYYNLKSDYVQVAHHGYYGLPKNVYDTIAPSVVLWPTPKYEWEADSSVNANMVYTRTWFPNAKNYISYEGPQSFTFPVIRSAAAVNIPDAVKPYVFDAKYYADNNTDLKNAYGYDEEKLYWHFVNFGIEEGRCASPFFDVKFYMNQNSQNFLYTMKGDYEKAFKHFLSNYNTTKLMKLSAIFDASVYASMYPQLAEDGIDTELELLKSFANGIYLRGKIATSTYPSADGTNTHSSCILTQALLPTCSAEGRTARIKCSACQTILQETTTLEMLPHSYDEGAVTTEATCAQVGVMTYTCKTCSATKTESIAIKEHTPVIDAAVDPNCTQVGWTEGSHCSVCNAVLVAQNEIASLGHDEVVDEGHAETCTQNGLTEGKHCGRCGEIIVSQEEIPASNHKNTTTVTTNATCTEDGSIVVTCDDCGEILRNEIIVATGHSYSSTHIAPSCTDRGYDFYFCACGDSYMDNEIAAMGHSYVYADNGDDTHTGTCFCGDAITESHNYVDGVCICGAVEITEPVLDSSLTFGAQLYLENDLTMAFRVKTDKLTAYDLSTACLVVERDVYESGAAQATVEAMTIREYKIENGRLIFSYPGIAAAQMNDAIRATFHIKNAKGQEYVSPVLNTSVATYLDGLLSASASDSKMVTLIMDMLNYGAAAQIYFDRHADAPVNEAFESFKTYASYASADFRTALENLSATENAEGKNGKLNLGLDLGTRIGIQYKVTVPADVNAEDVTLVVTDAEGNVLETLAVAGNETDSRGRYLVNFYGFTSRDMRRVVYATAYANGEAITGTYAYSISTYTWGVQENASVQPENLVNVTRAMLLYGDSAANYFA